MKHNIRRTSPKGPGEKFIGVCTLCGAPNLTSKDVWQDCPNQRGLTLEDSIMEAVTGKTN